MTELSKEYGTAIFMLAKESSAQREYERALDTVLELLRDEPEFMELLSSPAISVEERLEVIDKAFSTMPEHIVSFLKLLCERGRIRQLEDCVKEYKALLDDDMRVCVALVKSPVELTKEQRERLKNKLEKMSARSVILECVIDKSLMGGVAVELDGRIIDGSVRHRLNEIKEVMSK